MSVRVSLHNVHLIQCDFFFFFFNAALTPSFFWIRDWSHMRVYYQGNTAEDFSLQGKDLNAFFSFFWCMVY